MNCLKIDFRGESLREFVLTQCTTHTSAVSNCLKIDFREENFRKFAVTQCTTPISAVSNCLKLLYIFGEKTHESPQKREIRSSFLSRKKPAIRYCLCLAVLRRIHMNPDSVQFRPIQLATNQDQIRIPFT